MYIKDATKRIIKDPARLLAHACRHWPFRLISDSAFLKLYYYAYHGKKIDLKQPKTFNEKLQWLKLYNRRPEYTMMADKYLVRGYVKNTIGEEHLVPLIGVWDSPDDIPFEKLPEQFVLKCNHDCGSVVICRDKKTFDIKKAKKKLKHCLKLNQFWKGREYAYKNINRKIIAEKFMSNDGSNELTDYKFFCFDGEPKFIQIDTGRFTKHVRNYYFADWQFIDASYGCPNSKDDITDPPEHFDEMLELAKKLSKGMPHVRVDLYLSGRNIYFGELTFFHGGGAMNLEPASYDVLWGSYLKLPPKYQK